MKSFWAAVAIAAVLVAGGIFEYISIQSLSGRLIEDSDTAAKHITMGSYGIALEKAEELSELMDEKKMLLGSVINHERIDEIELCISELTSYCKTETGYEALVRCEKLKHLFFHLPANYSIDLENIL